MEDEIGEEPMIPQITVTAGPAEINVATVELSRSSLSARLRRALRFSGDKSLSSSKSTNDLQSSMIGDDADDTISISSTASSASVMLRKMSQGIKRGRKSIIGIFKGARRRGRESQVEMEMMMGEEEEEAEDKFPFGVPGEENTTQVSYVSVEGEMSAEIGDRRKSTVFSERESTLQIQLGKKKGKGRKVNLDSTPIRGILKSISPAALSAWIN